MLIFGTVWRYQSTEAAQETKISHLIPEQVGIIRYDGVISHGEDLVVVISHGSTESVDRSVGEAEAPFSLEPLFFQSPA